MGFGSPRTEPDGDLARLFDGLDPLTFDRNEDRRLDRKELARALFAALDLDGDKRLDRHELSRHPGRARPCDALVRSAPRTRLP